MNPFNHAILNAYGDIENISLEITSGSETVLSSISWLNAFKTSDFPNIVCDKTYFFLYSTDHENPEGSETWADVGALMYGKGNNLDLSDFQEVGQILSGWQCETPYPLHVPQAICGDTEEFHLFYHTVQQDPVNTNSAQETRLITTAGGAELHNCVFTDRGNPLEFLSGDTHTGYFIPYELSPGNYIGTHITESGLPQPWANSVSTNGRTWTRNEAIDNYAGIEPGYFAQLSEGIYFEKYNQIWWMGQIHPENGSQGIGDDRKLILAKATKIAGAITQVQLLNQGKTNVRHSVKIEGDTAHIYITNPVSKLYHATYDLKNLQQFL